MHDSLLSRSTKGQEKDCMNRYCIDSTRALEGEKGRKEGKIYIQEGVAETPRSAPAADLGAQQTTLSRLTTLPKSQRQYLDLGLPILFDLE